MHDVQVVFQFDSQFAFNPSAIVRAEIRACLSPWAWAERKIPTVYVASADIRTAFDVARPEDRSAKF